MKKTLLVMIVALAGAGIGYCTWCGSAAQRPEFRTLTVTSGDLLIGVTATGTVEPVEIIDVGAQIVGMIKSFGPDASRPGKTIDYCSHVKQGDVLARLDDLPYQAELAKAVAGLRLAEGELQQSRAHQAKAQRDLRRAERLRDTNAAADYEAATSQSELAQAELAMSEAKLEQAKSVKKEAEINIEYATIHAPVDGVVIARRVNVGQTVVAGLNAPSLFLLARDLSRMRVWAAVNEADIGDVHVGQKVTFKVDAYRSKTFSGKVSQIRMDASMSSSVVTYGVIVDVENSDGMLMPYMTAKLQFEVAKRTNVPLIPDQALRWRPTWEQITPSARANFTRPTPHNVHPDNDESGESDAEEPTVESSEPTAWVRADDGLVRPVPIKLGISDGMNTEMKGGELKVKDEVVINAIRAAKPDFVSSFIRHIVKK